MSIRIIPARRVRKGKTGNSVFLLLGAYRDKIGATFSQPVEYTGSLRVKFKSKAKIESIRKKAREAALKYAERQHRERAFTIAQTESAFAYNRGADEGIRQAQAEGYLGIVKKRWSTSGDDGVCEICSNIPGVCVLNSKARLSRIGCPFGPASIAFVHILFSLSATNME